MADPFFVRVSTFKGSNGVDLFGKFLLLWTTQSVPGVLKLWSKNMLSIGSTTDFPQFGGQYEEALSSALSEISVVSLRDSTLMENRGQGAFICDHSSGRTHATSISSLQKFVLMLAKQEKSLLVMIDVITGRFETLSPLDATKAIQDLVQKGFLIAELNREIPKDGRILSN